MPNLRMLTEYWWLGMTEMAEGLRQWRIWHLMGFFDLRRRYARSRLGQLWLTLSTGISVVALGLVWALLWRQPVAGLLPYFAASMVSWTFITGCITECSTAFVSNAPYYLNQRMSFSVSIAAVVYRNGIILLHNLIIVVLVHLAFFQVPTTALLLLPLGMILVALNLLLFGYLLGTLCARFRDLIQVVASLVQIAFFITPVLWKPSFLPADYAWLLLANPFAVLLSLIRDPLVGVAPQPLDWLVAILITTVGLVLVVPFIGSVRHKIIYWL